MNNDNFMTLGILKIDFRFVNYGEETKVVGSVVI